MANTPLHVAASHNSVEVVKYLLNLAGTKTIDLEAKNMYGETPSHMAAKNGSNEVARLLLSDGASANAKSNGCLNWEIGATKLLKTFRTRLCKESGIIYRLKS